LTNPDRTDGLFSEYARLIKEHGTLLALPVALFAIGLALHDVLTSLGTHFSFSDYLALGGIILFTLVTSVFTAAYLSRASLTRSLQDAGRSIDVPLLHAHDLIETCKQLRDMLKGDRGWILDDEAVSEIEAHADKQIIVVAPDLFYEKQQRYLAVIVTNLALDEGPIYRYVLPKDIDNEADKADLANLLKTELVRLRVTEPDKRLSERFVVDLLDDTVFPHSVLYGLAIYESRDGAKRCIQYLPREIGNMNVEIPCTSSSFGERLVSRVRHTIPRIQA